jgi:VIT1/CCC1 family predicted Fe2+/Mn2+ transporter
MKHPLKTGFSFGSTSGVITTLGLMVGLHSGTHSKLAVLGGILTIAIADAFSDALGIHISEESENKHSSNEIWLATISTFITKFVVSLTFVIPILLWQLNTAIIAGIIWGLFLITIISIRMAKQQNIKPHKAVLEHLFISLVVIIITHYVGDWVAGFSNTT